jgi:hypothetical protein
MAQDAKSLVLRAVITKAAAGGLLLRPARSKIPGQKRLGEICSQPRCDDRTATSLARNMISFTIGRRLNVHQCPGSQVHGDREHSAIWVRSPPAPGDVSERTRRTSGLRNHLPGAGFFQDRLGAQFDLAVAYVNLADERVAVGSYPGYVGSGSWRTERRPRLGGLRVDAGAAPPARRRELTKPAIFPLRVRSSNERSISQTAAACRC